MLSEQDKLAIQDFVKGNMNEVRLIAFKRRLEEEPALLRAVFLEKMLVQAAENLTEIRQSTEGLANARKIATNLGDDLFTDTEKTRLWEIRQQNEAQKYTYTELLNLFDTVKEYESNLVLRTNSSNEKIEVLQPENEIEANQTLNFELRKAISLPLTCIVQNNHEETVAETQINPHQHQFTIHLPKLNPGRYYWILKVASNNHHIRRQYPTLIGTFLIDAWLNPYEER